MPSPLGAQEIAQLLGVKDRTVHQWLRRQIMPTEDYPRVNGSRAWERTRVLRWAGKTGRLSTAELRAEFEERFKMPPMDRREAQLASAALRRRTALRRLR